MLPGPCGFEFAANSKHHFPWKFLHMGGIQLCEGLTSLEINKQRSIVVFLVRDFRSNCVGGPKALRC